MPERSSQQFGHEKLSVYQKALVTFERIHGAMSPWSKHHAFIDHLSRAAESILFNLAEGVRLSSDNKKALSVDYSIGSTFECAACLDIAALKELLKNTEATELKQALLEVSKMLVGLRDSWTSGRVAEGSEEYSTSNQPESGTVFYHETLDRYRVALDFYRWLVSTVLSRTPGGKCERSVDTLATRMVLNIAESSGRYAELSRQDFLDTANSAASTLAVSVDMGVRRGIWTASEAETGKTLLVRVGQMTARKGYSH
mgnify:CR=1 FL=1